MNEHLLIAQILFLAVMAGSPARLNAQQDQPQDGGWGPQFVPGTLVVRVTDRVGDTSLPSSDGYLGHFFTICSAKAREVLRGVTLAPDDMGAWFGW
jgi:hypothetical protein